MGKPSTSIYEYKKSFTYNDTLNQGIFRCIYPVNVFLLFGMGQYCGSASEILVNQTKAVHVFITENIPKQPLYVLETWLTFYSLRIGLTLVNPWYNFYEHLATA